MLVLELSSFQLQLFDASPQVGAVLNVTPNHLDRHPSMADIRLDGIKMQANNPALKLDFGAFAGQKLYLGREALDRPDVRQALPELGITEGELWRHSVAAALAIAAVFVVRAGSDPVPAPLADDVPAAAPVDQVPTTVDLRDDAPLSVVAGGSLDREPAPVPSHPAGPRLQRVRQRPRARRAGVHPGHRR